MSKSTPKPRQLELFGDPLPVSDALPAYYRRLRKAGVLLSYDRDTRQIFAGRPNRGVPDWAVTTIAQFRPQIVEDLLRVEHGVEPAAKPETLAGGAVLHRLPGRHRDPTLDPPVRPRPATATRCDPRGAA